MDVVRRNELTHVKEISTDMDTQRSKWSIGFSDHCFHLEISITPFIYLMMNYHNILQTTF